MSLRTVATFAKTHDPRCQSVAGELVGWLEERGCTPLVDGQLAQRIGYGGGLSPAEIREQAELVVVRWQQRVRSCGARRRLQQVSGHWRGVFSGHRDRAATLVSLRCECPVPGAYPNGECDVLLRADDIVHDDDAPVKAEIVRKAFRGSEFLYTLRLDNGQTVLAHVPSHHDHKLGEWIGIRIQADHVVTFDRLSNR
mgnify:CR=1 FL=1